MKQGVFSLALLGLLTKAMAASPSAAASLNTERGYAIFQQSCLTCHGNPQFERAPSPAALREMTPEHIYDALTSGAMYPIVGNTLSDADRKLVSEMIAGRLMGAGSGTNATLPVAYRCRRNPAMAAPSATDWNGWGRDDDNSRFQPNPGPKLNDKTVGRLKLKWAFGYPGSSSAYAQPTVVSGRVFVGTDTGVFYALNAETGCAYWSFQAKSGVRAAASVGRLGDDASGNYGVLFGDLKSNVYALDARSGRLIWTTRVEEHVTDRITAAPTLHEGVLYVPVSSWEEFAASAPLFSCCTSVGKIVALKAATGVTLWGEYVIPERPRPVRKNAQGVQQFAPAGGSVWNTPAVDPSLNAIYFGTGDATTTPAPATTDAILSFDMSSGKTLWSYQVHPNDSFLGGCFGKQKSDNCPDVVGPDWDIPVAPILVRARDGGRRLVVGTKPGDVLALDPDRHGSLLWRMNVSGPLASTETLKPGTFPLPGMMWGGATDGENVFFGLNKGGAVAIRAADGALVWKTELNALKGPNASNASPISVIPGAIFVGGMEGTLFALASGTGKELWRFNTARPFQTVNGVKAMGGSIYSAGPVIVNDKVFVGSGYSVLGGAPGNVLLAFALER
jgi:polyvinyl alcohol dehydrogenase (cytochrome)